VPSRRSVLRGAAVAAAVCSLGGCDRPPPYRPGLLRIATGGLGGVYYAYGQGIAAAVRARLPGLTPSVLATGASVDNLRMISAGMAELAFTLADSAAAAAAGQPPFDVQLHVMALARLYENYLHVVVPAASRVKTLSDLVGARVSLGAAGSGTEVIAARVLTAAGIDPRQDLTTVRHSVDDSARELAAGQLDGFFFAGGLPVAAIADLARAVPLRLLPVGDLTASLRAAHGEFYAERTIPASVYGLGGPVSTVGVPNYLVVGAGMASAVAYAVTRLLFERRATLARAHPEARRLDPRTAIGTYPLALHPGAVRYYRDAKR
jgi:TRAP transporter TAXI family solute receptor